MKLRTRKKLIKIIAVLIGIMFIFTAVVSAVMATETIHLELCHEDNCPVCMLIQTAINLIKNINEIIEYIVLLNIIVVQMFIITLKSNNLKSDTLVAQRVRLNE